MPRPDPLLYPISKGSPKSFRIYRGDSALDEIEPGLYIWGADGYTSQDDLIPRAARRWRPEFDQVPVWYD